MYMYVNKLKINTKQFDKEIVADYSGQKKNICLFPVPKVKKNRLIMQQYGQVVIFIEWHLKIDGFTVGALPVYWYIQTPLTYENPSQPNN